MCRAKRYTEQLLEIYDNINQDLEYFNHQIKEYQFLEQDVLHMIENNKFNAAEGCKLANMIKDARIKRRYYKDELETMINLKKTFIDKNIEHLKHTYESVKRQDEILLELKRNRVYRPRVLKSMELKIVVPLKRKVI